MQYTWHKFKITGLDKDTGRKSTVTIITRQDKPSEKDLIKQEILPPYKIVEKNFDEPTDAQKNYALNLGIKIIDGMNRQDVSALLSRYEDDDAPASDELKDFAYIKDVYFSPFVGENALRDLLSNELEGDDLRQFKKKFPEPLDDDFDDFDDIEISNVTDDNLYIDAGIYDESYSIDGQDGKIRLNFFAVIIKRGGKTPDVIIPLSKINDVHIGISDSIFDLNYIRFVLNGDDTTYYKPSSFPPKGFDYAVRFSNKKYVPIAERIKHRVAELSTNKMTVTGAYTPNQKPYSHHYFSMGCIGAVGLLILCLIFSSCFGGNEDVETKISPAPKIEESAKQNLPTKISPLPSIGATREEFAKTFTENARNDNDYIRYNNDGILVTFGSDGRASIVSLQPLAENNYLNGINPRDFLPSDTVQIDEKKTKIMYEAKGTSELLRQVCPASQGNFGAGAMYKDNGDVISITISIF